MTTYLTIEEVAALYRISKNTAYLEARRYRESGGQIGIPNCKIGGSYRVPVDVINRMADLHVPGEDT